MLVPHLKWLLGSTKALKNSEAAVLRGRVDALDGLRTIAVGLVVLFHISLAGFKAGFIGVDVFFVLSGYLITSSLANQLKTDGRIELKQFWVRRFKRLMPAAALLILTVLSLTLILGTKYQAVKLGKDAWWVTLYLGNWLFMDSGTYFNSTGAPSELLHMWSLAVEEQFYLVWPLLLAACAGIVILWKKSRKIARSDSEADFSSGTGLAIVRFCFWLAIAALLVSVTLLWYWYLKVPNPDRAYMGTDSKIFEPLIGAALALGLTNDKLRDRLAPWANRLVWLGFAAGIFLYFFMAGPAKFYFTGGSLLFSLSVAAVIAGIVLGATNPITAVLAFSPIAYLGRISYGIYLWHWPYAVWFNAHEHFGPRRAAAVLVLTLVSAVLSYHVVEIPIRQGKISKWLTEWKTLISALIVMVMLLGLASYAGGTPATSLLRKATKPVKSSGGTIMIVGDSVPKRLSESLAKAGQERGLNFYSAALGGCSPLGVEIVTAPGDVSGKNCLAEVIKTQQAGLVEQPDVVLWWSRYEIADRYVDGVLLTPEDDGFWEAQLKDFRSRVNDLTKDGAKLVVVLTEPPSVGMKTRCSADDCVPLLRRMVYHDEYRVKWNSILANEAKQDPRITAISIDKIACPKGVPSPVEGAPFMCDDRVDVSGNLLRPDGSHFDTQRYGLWVADQIIDEIDKALQQG